MNNPPNDSNQWGVPVENLVSPQQIGPALAPELPRTLVDALQLPGNELFGPEKDQSIYCLPDNAIAALSSPIGPQGMTWLDEPHAEAESAYARHCDSMNCVGFQSNGPIVYHLLGPKSLKITEADIAFMGNANADRRSARATATNRLRVRTERNDQPLHGL